MRVLLQLFRSRGLFYLCRMVQAVEVREFLALRDQHVPVLDVRSPAEFDHAHIDGARSFPLFDDVERSEVGTLYKQVSAEAAMMRGLTIVGPKMARFLEDALAISPDRRVAVYCARGGKRSESMAWLLHQGGFEVTVLKGGYKKARRYYLDTLLSGKWRFAMLGGHTGSGKTAILRALASEGAQVIDLEALARHRGSAFGARNDTGQPSCEDFENRLAEALLHLAPGRIIWMENESRHIGRVRIPTEIWSLMRSAPLVQLEVPREDRLHTILEEYGEEDLVTLREAFLRIRQRMGPQHADAAVRMLDTGDLAGAAGLALDYYDRLYAHNWVNPGERLIHHVDGIRGDVPAMVHTLLELEKILS